MFNTTSFIISPAKIVRRRKLQVFCFWGIRLEYFIHVFHSPCLKLSHLSYYVQTVKRMKYTTWECTNFCKTGNFFPLEEKLTGQLGNSAIPKQNWSLITRQPKFLNQHIFSVEHFLVNHHLIINYSTDKIFPPQKNYCAYVNECHILHL